MKVVVLCGGLSTERKISLATGTKVCIALRERGHQAVPADLFLGLTEYGEEAVADPSILFEKLPPVEAVKFDGQEPDLKAVALSRKPADRSLFGPGVLELCKAADIVFMALHGMNGEDGRVQAAFDLMGIPYTGSGHLGSAMAMDKILTKQMVKEQEIKTPEFTFYRNVGPEDLQEIFDDTPIPCVVKTPTGGSSVGVFIVRDEDALRDALKACLSMGSSVLIEELIEGREFTCGVLRGKALPSVEIRPLVRFYDYTNKYMAGATEEICPGRTTPEVEKRIGDTALAVHTILGLRTYSRSDFIVTDDNEVYFLEVNTLPGMTDTSLVPQEAAAVGISYGELCEMILEDGLRKYRSSLDQVLEN